MGLGCHGRDLLQDESDSSCHLDAEEIQRAHDAVEVQRSILPTRKREPAWCQASALLCSGHSCTSAQPVKLPLNVSPYGVGVLLFLWALALSYWLLPRQCSKVGTQAASTHQRHRAGRRTAVSAGSVPKVGSVDGSGDGGGDGLHDRDRIAAAVTRKCPTGPN